MIAPVVVAASWAGTYLPLIIAGAGVFVALFATLYRLRRDQQHWRGERRLDAYAEFIDSARTFLFLGDEVGEPDLDRPDDAPELVHRRQIAALRDRIRRLRQAVGNRASVLRLGLGRHPGTKLRAMRSTTQADPAHPVRSDGPTPEAIPESA